VNFHLSTNFKCPVVSLLKEMSKKRLDDGLFVEEPCETFRKSLLLDLLFELLENHFAYDYYIAESKNRGSNRSNWFLFSILM
jgi:hypothetical protein